MADLPPSIGIAIEDGIAIVTLSRPEKRNALDTPTVTGLGAFFAAPPPGVRAAVLLGAGPHFCAGLDLAEVAGAQPPLAMVAHSRMWHRAFGEIEFGAVPVVAALHGAVVGGGLELAAATHVRVAEASAYYALPEAQRGLFVGGGGSVRISRLVGAHRVMDMMLTGRVLGAEEGQAAGITSYLVPSGEGRRTAVALAGKIATNAPASNYAIVQALPRIARSDPEAGLFTEALMAAVAEAAPEARERLNEFLEKRTDKVAPDRTERS